MLINLHYSGKTYTSTSTIWLQGSNSGGRNIQNITGKVTMTTTVQKTNTCMNEEWGETNEFPELLRWSWQHWDRSKYDYQPAYYRVWDHTHCQQTTHILQPIDSNKSTHSADYPNVGNKHERWDLNRTNCSSITAYLLRYSGHFPKIWQSAEVV